MPELPLISIVTPSYNQGQFIEETILSVLNQDYPNIEYIVVDGDSTDHTIDILKRYEGKLKWVSEKDNGQSDAINKGFRMAKGDMLAWLNSDDAYLPGAVSKAVEYFNSRADIGMVYGKTHYIDEMGNIVAEYPTGSFDYKRLAVFNFICQSSTFFKREVYFNAGGLDLDLHFTMDYDLWIKISRKFRIEYIPEFMSTYRLHPESKTVSEPQALRFHEECLKTVMRYYQWAPLNRVYGYCYHRILSRLTPSLKRIMLAVLLLATILSIKEYLKLNRGIRLDDIKLITPTNIRKIFRGWEAKDIIKNA